MGLLVFLLLQDWQCFQAFYLITVVVAVVVVLLSVIVVAMVIEL
jgi:hypothetical protein